LPRGAPPRRRGAAGLSDREASALTFSCSAFSEITGEQVAPSRNDQVASGIAGSFIGDPLFRISHLVLSDRSGRATEWRRWLAAAVSPAVGLNRWVFGSRFDNAFQGHNPSVSSRLRIGPTLAEESGFDAPVDHKAKGLKMDFQINEGRARRAARNGARLTSSPHAPWSRPITAWKA